jgi:hypothetical protein
MPFYGEEDVARFLDPPLEERPLDRLFEAVDALLPEVERFSTELDAALAPILHSKLPISRREAADPGVWRYLAVVARPDIIRHRWENRSWATMQTRFWMPGTRPDSNTLGRLWWVAEMSHEDGDYALTRQVLRRQTLTNSLFVRSFAAHRPVVRAMVEVLGDADSAVIERVTREFNARLSIHVLETMSLAGIKREIRDLLRS